MQLEFADYILTTDIQKIKYWQFLACNISSCPAYTLSEVYKFSEYTQHKIQIWDFPKV